MTDDYAALGAELAALAPGDPARTEIADRMFRVYVELLTGGVTSRGYPYPLPTDPISQGADAIRALAEAIGADDMPWTNLTPASGWTIGTGSLAPQVMRRGDLVYYHGNFAGGTVGSTATTLPTWARPIRNSAVVIPSGSGTVSYMVIQPTGVLQPQTASMTGATIAFWTTT